MRRRVLAFLCAAAAAAPAAVAPERTCAVHESPHHVLLNTPKWRGGHPLAPPDVAPLHLAPITTAAELLSSTSSSNQPSVVFFCASWCTPCAAAQRVVDAAAAEPWGALGLSFLRADGAALDAAALHNVTELPALAFYDGRGGNATAHLSWRAAPALPEVLRFVKAQLRAHAAASRASREVLLAEWVAGRPKAPRSSRGRIASAANLLANNAPPTAAADANRTAANRTAAAATARRRSRSALQLLDWVAGKPERPRRARRRKSAASAGALPFLELFSKRS
jgi:thiol-disulfide isomerase/thioredoxin